MEDVEKKLTEIKKKIILSEHVKVTTYQIGEKYDDTEVMKWRFKNEEKIDFYVEHPDELKNLEKRCQVKKLLMNKGILGSYCKYDLIGSDEKVLNSYMNNEEKLKELLSTK